MFCFRNVSVLAIVLTGALCHPQPSAASLGDSEEQVIARMGDQPRKTLRGNEQLEPGGDRTHIFVVDLFGHPFEVQVTFIGNESVREIWFMMDRDHNPTPMPRDVMDTLLSLNKQGHNWAPVPGFWLIDSNKDGKDDFAFVWYRSDNQMTTAAVQTAVRNSLDFQSHKYKKARDAAR